MNKNRVIYPGTCKIKTFHVLYLIMQMLYICHTDQHTEEPQVCFVVFLEPSSINMKPIAGEAYHGVVCADDQDEKNQCSNHRSLVWNSTKTHISFYCLRHKPIICFTSSLIYKEWSKEPFKTSQCRLSPSVPNKQPANIQTQIEAPAN